MLEGKELEGQLGKFGNYSVDIDDKGVLSLGLSFKLDIVAELGILAKSSESKVDDILVEAVRRALGRSEEAAS